MSSPSNRLPRYPWWGTVDTALAVLDRRYRARLDEWSEKLLRTPEVERAIGRRRTGSISAADRDAARDVVAIVVPRRSAEARLWRRELLAPFAEGSDPPLPGVGAPTEKPSLEFLVSHLLHARWHLLGLCAEFDLNPRDAAKGVERLARTIVRIIVPLPGEARSQSSRAIDSRLDSDLKAWLPELSRHARCRLVARVRAGFVGAEDDVTEYANRLEERFRKQSRRERARHGAGKRGTSKRHVSH